MGDIDVEHARLDIDRHVRLRQLALGDELAKGSRAAAHSASRLAALLVADKGENEGRIDRHASEIKRAYGFKSRAETGLQIARAAPPYRAVDERAAERVFTFRARPAFAPAADVHRVGMSDQQH